MVALMFRISDQMLERLFKLLLSLSLLSSSSGMDQNWAKIWLKLPLMLIFLLPDSSACTLMILDCDRSFSLSLSQFSLTTLLSFLPLAYLPNLPNTSSILILSNTPCSNSFLSMICFCSQDILLNASTTCLWIFLFQILSKSYIPSFYFSLTWYILYSLMVEFYSKNRSIQENSWSWQKMEDCLRLKMWQSFPIPCSLCFMLGSSDSMTQISQFRLIFIDAC